MTIEHEESGNRFVMKMKDDEAFISYDKPNDRTLNIFHTEVPEAFEGQGVGSKLARYALDYARANGYKVVPSCPFVNSWLQKHHEYDDVVER